MTDDGTKAGEGDKMRFLHWLTLLFVGLKLSGQIDWSWWWVLSPIVTLSVVHGVAAGYRTYKRDRVR